MTTGIRKENGLTIIEARTANPVPERRCCLLYPDTLKKNGVRVMKLTDMPHMMNPTELHYSLQKWRCRNENCNANHLEREFIKDEKREITQRCATWIFKQSMDLTFTKVAEIVGLHERSVRRIFNDTADECISNLNIATPRVLGIDEKHVMRQGRGIFGDVENRCVIDMLPSCTFKPMEQWVKDLPDKDRVEVVTIDMSRNYRDIVLKHLKDATLVVDKFHIMRYATKAMDHVRKALRAELSDKARKSLLRGRYTLLKRRRNWHDKDHDRFQSYQLLYPELVEAFEWKEAVHDIFDMQIDKYEALARYLEWEAKLPPHLANAFLEFTRPMANWRPYILNYFDHRYTNAYVERLNGSIAAINTMGRGYSFDVLRARVMLKYSLETEVTGPLPDGVAQFATIDADDDVVLDVIGHGVPLATLADAWRAELSLP